MTSPIMRVRDVTRRYGDVVAVDGVSLDIAPGELVGLLGPNGAGKTTLINLLVGLRRPDSGTVELCGGNPRDEATRQAIGVTPQQTALPEAWRVGELIDFIAAHYPNPTNRDDLLARFDLQDLCSRQIGGLSGGQQRRVAVALAFAGNPRVVFLDEPSTGLDVEARRQLWTGIRAFHDEGGTVLLTSHYLEEVEALAQRVAVVDRGRVIADGSVRDVRGLVSLKRVSLICPELPSIPGVARVEHNDRGNTTVLTNDADHFVRELVTSGASFSELEIRSASLEDAFLSITSKHVA
ncbi:ABC transporter ATP-binding protein [Hoyosella subflava]|uniref:ABC transporter-like protein n=1 Tax=Hoyosella subflava (strain DSM 45089 / JCM 17490 / NBRC 109087 / DQS3-9A1) TaxID=443218 RepID=F6EJV8_HOYSD|nr:ABC transporter ATP-binding protein [Hoyosella subflava]AEF41316.1 ABC transporter-like protein [Hoyosella subflava DQS3-9A1]